MINDFSISRSVIKSNAIVIMKYQYNGSINNWTFIRINVDGITRLINIIGSKYHIIKGMDLVHTKKGNSIVRIVGVDDL